MQSKIEAYLKADRQWSRIHRIRYAREQLKVAKSYKDEEAIVFWVAVLIANGGQGRILPSTTWTLERSLADVRPSA